MWFKRGTEDSPVLARDLEISCSFLAPPLPLPERKYMQSAIIYLLTYHAELTSRAPGRNQQTQLNHLAKKGKIKECLLLLTSSEVQGWEFISGHRSAAVCSKPCLAALDPVASSQGSTQGMAERVHTRQSPSVSTGSRVHLSRCV